MKPVLLLLLLVVLTYGDIQNKRKRVSLKKPKYQMKPLNYRIKLGKFHMKPGKLPKKSGKVGKKPRKFYKKRGKPEKKPVTTFSVLMDPVQAETKPGKLETKPGKFSMKPIQPDISPGISYKKPGKAGKKPKRFYSKPGKPEKKPEKTFTVLLDPVQPDIKPGKVETKPGKPEKKPVTTFSVLLDPVQAETKPGKPETKPNLVRKSLCEGGCDGYERMLERVENALKTFLNYKLLRNINLKRLINSKNCGDKIKYYKINNDAADDMMFNHADAPNLTICQYACNDVYLSKKRKRTELEESLDRYDKLNEKLEKEIQKFRNITCKSS